MNLTFGIDYDDTFTADPELWKRFISDALSRGHAVRIVTCRRDTIENRQEIAQETELPEWRILCTSMSPKRWYCEQKQIKVDIWIDDMPESVINGR